MKLSKSQKIVLLSAIGLFRHMNHLPSPPPEFQAKYEKIGKWYEAQTGTTGSNLMAISRSTLVHEALVIASEAIIAAEEPEGPDAELTVVLRGDNIH